MDYLPRRVGFGPPFFVAQKQAKVRFCPDDAPFMLYIGADFDLQDSCEISSLDFLISVERRQFPIY